MLTLNIRDIASQDWQKGQQITKWWTIIAIVFRVLVSTGQAEPIQGQVYTARNCQFLDGFL